MFTKAFVPGVLAIPLTLLAVQAIAEDVADFYKGRQITIVIGNFPGNTADIAGRLLGRHMRRHISGAPTFVPQNMPGAGSVKAANYIYNIAPKDGSTIGIFNSSAVFEPKIGNDQAKYDGSRFNWIGNIDESVTTCVVWHTSGVEKFEDLMKVETLFGSTSPSANFSLTAYAIKNFFGAKMKIIQGYEGGPGVPLAMARGEVQGQCAMARPLLRTQYAQYVEAGQLKPIIQLGMEKHPDLAGIPHIYDYAKTESDRQLFDLIFGKSIIARPIAAPPSLPADRVKVLREAFMLTMQDQRFLEEAEKLKIEVTPWSGERVEETFAKFFSYPDAVWQKAEAITHPE